jgi:hypothetical protein
MRLLSTIALGALVGSAVGLGVGTPAANAATYSCPPASLGTGQGDLARVYQLSSALGCAYGSGNLENLNVTAGVTVTAYKDTYPNPPAPTTGIYPIPAGANLLGTWDPAALTGTGTLVSFTGSTTGTITFSSLFNFLNVLVAIQDGNVTPGPRWAVFNVGSVLAGTILDWDYLTCNNGHACGAASSAASGLIVWGDTRPTGRGGQETPLPGALPLFGSVLGGGFIFSKWRRKRRASLAA